MNFTGNIKTLNVLKILDEQRTAQISLSAKNPKNPQNVKFSQKNRKNSKKSGSRARASLRVWAAPKVLGFLLIFIFLSTTPLLAVSPNNRPSTPSYTWNITGIDTFTPVPAPAPYRFSRSVYPEDMGVSSLTGVTEILHHDGRFFITNGPSLVVTNYDLVAEQIITGAYLDGVWQDFGGLNGLFITDNGDIYVVETSAGRIWHLDSEFNTIRVLGRPEGIPLAETFAWQPLKVAVDQHGRIYTIANNVFEGIVEINADGSFNRYFGVLDVRFSAVELFWRNLATQAQLAQASLWLPINFTNMDIHPDGFVFATLADEPGAKMLNARGDNIMRNPFGDPGEYPVGDVEFPSRVFNAPTGPSISSIIRYFDAGMYYVWDSNRNRVFAYDQDGNLLFAFGGQGTAEGRLLNVVGMTMTADRLLLADRGNRSIEVFDLTSYGAAVINAARLTFDNNYMQAADAWLDVIDYNPFHQLAHLGVGKALFRQGLFAESIPYFQQAQAVEYYSLAFARVRQDAVDRYFDTAVIAVAIFAAVIVAIRLFRRFGKFPMVKKGRAAL